jgi:hypothetical protein
LPSFSDLSIHSPIKVEFGVFVGIV